LNAVDSDIVISYVPFGTGNAIGSSLGIPKDAVKAYEKAKKGKKTRIDTIKYEDEIALFAGVGLDAQIVKERAELLEKGYKGTKANAIPLLRQIPRGLPNYQVNITADGQTYEDNAIMVVASKISDYGYGLQVMPKAKLDDGKIHMKVFPSKIIPAAVGLVSGFLKKQVAGKYISGKEITISSDKDVPFHLNGTYHARGTEFNLRIKPKSHILKF